LQPNRRNKEKKKKRRRRIRVRVCPIEEGIEEEELGLGFVRLKKESKKKN
jgi:hypothetical protein